MKINRSIYNLLLFIAGSFIVGCSSQHAAPIEQKYAIKQQEVAKPYSEPQQADPIEEEDLIVHEVCEGETLSVIAKKYNVTTEELVQINHVSPNKVLEVFEIIFVPKQKSSLAVDQKDNISLSMPVEGKILYKFGQYVDGKKSDGISIMAEKDSVVKAAMKGEVVHVSYDNYYGNIILIQDSESGYLIAYGHMNSYLVHKGVKVKEGEVIGYLGNTGKVDIPQLYFAVKIGNTNVNPEKLF